MYHMLHCISTFKQQNRVQYLRYTKEFSSVLWLTWAPTKVIKKSNPCRRYFTRGRDERGITHTSAMGKKSTWEFCALFLLFSNFGPRIYWVFWAPPTGWFPQIILPANPVTTRKSVEPVYKFGPNPSKSRAIFLAEFLYAFRSRSRFSHKTAWQAAKTPPGDTP